MHLFFLFKAVCLYWKFLIFLQIERLQEDFTRDGEKRKMLEQKIEVSSSCNFPVSINFESKVLLINTHFLKYL